MKKWLENKPQIELTNIQNDIFKIPKTQKWSQKHRKTRNKKTQRHVMWPQMKKFSKQNRVRFEKY